MTKGGGSIEFSGSLGEGLGIAMWQADGTGPEPAAVGHSYTTPIDVITAHYYIASRDYVDPTARGAVAAGALAGSWPHVRAALKKHERLASELVMRLPLRRRAPTAKAWIGFIATMWRRAACIRRDRCRYTWERTCCLSSRRADWC